LFPVQGSTMTLGSLAGIGGSKKNRPVGEIVITECFPEFLMAPFDCLPLTCYWWLRFRGRVRFFVEHRFFEWFILSLVFISSFVLVSLSIINCSLQWYCIRKHTGGSKDLTSRGRGGTQGGNGLGCSSEISKMTVHKIFTLKRYPE